MFRIKEILKEQGKTQVQLAKELGISPISLNQSIQHNPTISTLQKIAEALCVEVRDLFEYSSEYSDTIYIKRGDNYVPIGRLEVKV